MIQRMLMIMDYVLIMNNYFNKLVLFKERMMNMYYEYDKNI